MTNSNIMSDFNKKIALRKKAIIMMLGQPVNRISASYTIPYLDHRTVEAKSSNEFGYDRDEQVGVTVNYFNKILNCKQTMFFPTVQKFENQYERKLLDIEDTYIHLQEILDSPQYQDMQRGSMVIVSKTSTRDLAEIDINEDEIPF